MAAKWPLSQDALAPRGVPQGYWRIARSAADEETPRAPGWQLRRNLTPLTEGRRTIWQSRQIAEVSRPRGREAMNTWLSTGEGLVAAAIAVIGSVFTFTANRRAQYDLSSL